VTRRAGAFALLLGLLAGGVTPARAQDQRDEQFYFPGSFNWQFLRHYPDAARLFNAFDYGHAVLYERLLTRTGDARRRGLEREYRYLTTDLLVRPPRFAIAEEAVMPAYARLAWRAKEMFDWAHVLHRQIYDVYADERLSEGVKDSLVERITDYYLSRTDYAFAPVPKVMGLMEDQYFSQTFRRNHSTFNGLIWAYHWLQVGLYEPLLVYRTPTDRAAGIAHAVARFRGMIANPGGFPRVMPMTAVVAPTFARRHPRAAAIFDNLHMMHDIISDVLASDAVPTERKRAVIYEQLAELRNATGNTMSAEEWWHMGEHMGGAAAMGGPAVEPR
jgi:hypothetical protein